VTPRLIGVRLGLLWCSRTGQAAYLLVLISPSGVPHMSSAGRLHSQRLPTENPLVRRVLLGIVASHSNAETESGLSTDSSPYRSYQRLEASPPSQSLWRIPRSPWDCINCQSWSVAAVGHRWEQVSSVSLALA
jgi:hypothetical protein